MTMLLSEVLKFLGTPDTEVLASVRYTKEEMVYLKIDKQEFVEFLTNCSLIDPDEPIQASTDYNQLYID